MDINLSCIKILILFSVSSWIPVLHSQHVNKAFRDATSVPRKSTFFSVLFQTTESQTDNKWMYLYLLKSLSTRCSFTAPSCRLPRVSRQRPWVAGRGGGFGPHLLQHVFREVLLLVHGEDGSLHLLVGQLQPAAGQTHFVNIKKKKKTQPPERKPSPWITCHFKSVICRPPETAPGFSKSFPGSIIRHHTSII